MAKVQNTGNTPNNPKPTGPNPSGPQTTQSTTYSKIELSQLAGYIKQLNLQQKEIQQLVLAIETKVIDPKNLSQLKEVKNYVEDLVKNGKTDFFGGTDFTKFLKSLKVADGLISDYESKVKTVDKHIVSSNLNLQTLNASLTTTGSSTKKISQAVKSMSDDWKETVDVAGLFNDALEESYEHLSSNSNLLGKLQKQLTISPTTFNDQIQQIFASRPPTNLFSDSIKDLSQQVIEQSNTILDDMYSNITNSKFSIGGVEMNYDSAVESIQKMYDDAEKLAQDHIKNLSQQIADRQTSLGVTVDPAKLTELSDKISDSITVGTSGNLEIDTTKLQGLDTSTLDSWNQLDEQSKLLVYQLAEANKQIGLLPDQARLAATSLKNVSGTWRNGMTLLQNASKEAVDEIEVGVNRILPTWSRGILQTDKAFASLNESITKGITAATQEMANSGDRLSALKKFGAEFNMEMRNAPTILRLALSPLGAMIGLFAGLGVAAVAYYKNIKNISKEMGISKAQAIQMHAASLRLVETSKNQLVTQEDVQEVMKSHLETYGKLANVSSKEFKTSLENAAQLSKQFGTTTASMYELQDQLGRLGLDQKSIDGMINFMGNASEMSDIPFGEISKDLKENSAFVYKQFVGMPNQIGKSITSIKKMGGSLKDVEQIFDKMLDISGFTTDMTELFIMSNGAADLTKAMEMRFTPGTDPAEVLKEVITQYDSLIASGEANPFALAKMEELTGKTADELSRMSKINKMSFENEQDRLLMAKHGSKLTEEQLQDKEKALQLAKEMENMDRVSSQMERVKASIMSAMLPVVERVVSVLSDPDMVNSINTVAMGFATGVGYVFKLIQAIAQVGDWVKRLAESISIPGAGLLGMVTTVGLLWGGFKLLGMFIGTLATKALAGLMGMFGKTAASVNTNVQQSNLFTQAINGSTTAQTALNAQITRSIQLQQQLNATAAQGRTTVPIPGAPTTIPAPTTTTQPSTSKFPTPGTLTPVNQPTPRGPYNPSYNPNTPPIPPPSTPPPGTPPPGTPGAPTTPGFGTQMAGMAGSMLIMGGLTSGEDPILNASENPMTAMIVSMALQQGLTKAIPYLTSTFQTAVWPAITQGAAALWPAIASGASTAVSAIASGASAAASTASTALAGVSAGAVAAAAGAAAGVAAIGVQAWKQVGSEALNAGSAWQDVGNFVAGTGSQFFGGAEKLLGTGLSEALGTAYKGLRSDQMENFRGAYRAMTGEQIGLSDESNQKLIDWVKANEGILSKDSGTKDAFEALQKKLDSGEIKVISKDVTKNENWDAKIAKEKAAEQEKQQKQANVKQVGYANQPGYVPPQVKQQGYLTAETLTPQQVKARQFTADIRKKQLELANIPAPTTVGTKYPGQDSEKEMRQIRTTTAAYPGAATTQEMQQAKDAGRVLSDAQAAATATQINAGSGKADPNIARLADAVSSNANRPLEVQVQIGDVEMRRVATQLRQYNNK